jgi:hypothetical protein
MRALLCCAGIALAAASTAGATPVFSVAPGTCPNNAAACSASNDEVTSTLFNIFLINPLNDTTGAYGNLFVPAFNAWNASLPAGRKWSLVAADLNAAATIDVTTYRAYVNEGDNCDEFCGGAEIDINYNWGGGTNNPLPIRDTARVFPFSALWTQSIFTSDKQPGALPGNPYLDNNPNTPGRRFNPPAYPFQETGSSFFDKPAREADNTWMGQAFLMKANYRTRTLTVYDGVGWGFYVQDVPEPATLALSGCGVLGLLLYARRRRQATTRRICSAVIDSGSASRSGFSHCTPTRDAASSI